MSSQSSLTSWVEDTERSDSQDKEESEKEESLLECEDLDEDYQEVINIFNDSESLQAMLDKMDCYLDATRDGVLKQTLNWSLENREGIVAGTSDKESSQEDSSEKDDIYAQVLDSSATLGGRKKVPIKLRR